MTKSNLGHLLISYRLFGKNVAIQRLENATYNNQLHQFSHELSVCKGIGECVDIIHSLLQYTVVLVQFQYNRLYRKIVICHIVISW